MDSLREAIRDVHRMDNYIDNLKQFLSCELVSDSKGIALAQLIEGYERTFGEELPLKEFTTEKAKEFLKKQFGETHQFTGDQTNLLIKAKTQPKRKKQQQTIPNIEPTEVPPVAAAVATEFRKLNQMAVNIFSNKVEAKADVNIASALDLTIKMLGNKGDANASRVSTTEDVAMDLSYGIIVPLEDIPIPKLPYEVELAAAFDPPDERQADAAMVSGARDDEADLNNRPAQDGPPRSPTEMASGDGDAIGRYRSREDLFKDVMSDEITSSSAAANPKPNYMGEEGELDEIDAMDTSEAVGDTGEAAGDTGEAAIPMIEEYPDNDVSTSGIYMTDDYNDEPAADKDPQPSPSKRQEEAAQDTRDTIPAKRKSALSKEDRMRIKVWKLVAGSPGGIFCRELYAKYKELYGRTLRYNNIDYSTPFLLMEAMDLDILITRPFGESGDYLLALAPPGSNGPIDLSELGPGGILPSSCMQNGDTIPLISRDAYPAGHLLLATVAGINSPSDFIIVRYGAENHVPLERISEEMRCFYDSDGLALEIPRSEVRVDLICSANFSGLWHRARITDIIGADHVKIRHVDYGTDDTVSVRVIRPLLRQWAQLPIQAIRARLNSVGPPAYANGYQWPSKATKAFEKLVINKAVFVHIMSVDLQTVPVVEVAIIDTSTSEDRWVDIELIKGGHAEELRAGPRHLNRRLA